MCCIFQNITFTSFFSFRTLYLSGMLLNIPWRSEVNNVSNKDPTQIYYKRDVCEPPSSVTQRHNFSQMLIELFVDMLNNNNDKSNNKSKYNGSFLFHTH